jgi:tetratricopeptide (TPR) repeat protein
VGVLITSLIVLIALLIGSISFGAWINAERSEALRQEKIAKEQEGIAKANEEKAVANFEEAEKQRMIAKSNEEKAVANFEEAEKQRMIANEKTKEAISERARAAELLQQANQARLAFEVLAAAILPAEDDWPTIPPFELAAKLDLVGSCRLDLEQYMAAEELLLKALEIRQRETPEAWETFQTRSLLGEALFRQDRFADAEPHLVAGYEGLATRQDTIPPNVGTPIADALDRLIALYERLGQTAEVQRYRSLRGK